MRHDFVLFAPGVGAEDETTDHPRVGTREGHEVAIGDPEIVTAETVGDPGLGTDTGGPGPGTGIGGPEAETDTGGPDPETGEVGDGAGAGTGVTETEVVRAGTETAETGEAL